MMTALAQWISRAKGWGVDPVDRQALRSDRSLLFITEKLYSTNKVVNSLDKPKPADSPLAQVIQNELKHGLLKIRPRILHLEGQK